MGMWLWLIIIIVVWCCCYAGTVRGGGSDRSRYAYVTVMIMDDDYLDGVLALMQSIKDSGSTYDRICMYTDGVSKKAVARLAKLCTPMHVPYIRYTHKPMMNAKLEKMYGYFLDVLWTKFHIFDKSRFPYEKVLFVDSDVVILENVDCIFDMNTPAGVFASPYHHGYGDGEMPNFYGKPKHGDIIPRSAIVKSLTSGVGTNVVNSGFFLIEPSNKTLARMHEILRSKPAWGYDRVASSTDEQLLVEVYPTDWTNIHQRYNVLTVLSGGYMRGEVPAVMHYHGKPKPWQKERGKPPPYEDHKLWWYFAKRAGIHTDIDVMSPKEFIRVSKK